LRRGHLIAVALSALALVTTGVSPASGAPLEATLAPASGTRAATFDGHLAVWPVIGEITSPFAPRWGSFHNGLDIAVPMYTPIRAAAAGRVTTVGKPYLAYGDNGEVVVISHGGGFLTEYVHLDDSAHPPIVHVGQLVSAGQVIAYVGLTGWTTGPHLHFMTILNARAQDPLRYLPPR
jgi:murein DD-endopeptidase MepM/ murein hydrolase activator NlpD